MNIHEYQTKNLLERYGIPVSSFFVAATVDEVIQALKERGFERGVVKAQIHAGGRGKAGGVKLADSPEEIVRIAQMMLGSRLVTNQTGPQGIEVKKILVSETVDIEKEGYLALVIDRSLARPVLIASPLGGMEIEQIAHDRPDALLTIPVELDGHVRSYHLLELAKFMGWEGNLRKEGIELASKLSAVFMENDGSLLEINPLALTKEGHLVAIDAKFSLDDNALYRQPAIAQWYDSSQYTPNEVMAKEFGLTYIGLNGDIGCLVNGAGLAMATMDIIHHYGGEPANFLDVGGGATKEQIAQGFKAILQDPEVKAIFVNIFGGIMDCALIAEGIITACKENPLKVPLVVRLEGTNVESGRHKLKESGLKILTANTMEDGAQKVVQAAKQGG